MDTENTLDRADKTPEQKAAVFPALPDTGNLQQRRVLPHWLQPGHQPLRRGYLTSLSASCTHALLILTRRKRLLMATVIAFLPVLIPVALAFLSESRFAESGNEVFVKLVEQLHINVFAPLLALFFAGMLVATQALAALVAEDAALGYKNLLEAERGFRDLKSTLELRPVHHHLEPRIRAHVLLCWLALLLIRVAERSTGLTWRRIAIELGRVHAVTLTGTAGSVVHVTALNTTQTGILTACKVTPPPTITTLNPA